MRSEKDTLELLEDLYHCVSKKLNEIDTEVDRSTYNAKPVLQEYYAKFEDLNKKLGNAIDGQREAVTAERFERLNKISIMAHEIARKQEPNHKTVRERQRYFWVGKAVHQYNNYYGDMKDITSDEIDTLAREMST